MTTAAATLDLTPNDRNLRRCGGLAPRDRCSLGLTTTHVVATTCYDARVRETSASTPRYVVGLDVEIMSVAIV